MEQLIYLFEVSVGLALFFAFYLLVLRKLTFFKLSRLYLLSALFLSFSIPALQFKIEKVIEVKQIIQPSPIAVNFTDAINANAVEVKEMPVESTFDWLLIVPFAYWITALAIFCFGFYRVYQLIKFTRANSRLYNGLKIISKTSGFTNCSFFNYVFIDETNLSETDLQVLLKHEQVHAQQYHSVDKLIMMIAKALLWFNPIVYLFDKALEQVHEYEADAAASQSFGNSAYANLLLGLAVHKNEMPLIHNFVKSPIKERIKMLFNSKSKDMKKLAYLLAVPIAIGLVWVFAVQVVYAQAKPNTTFDIQPAETGEIIKGKIIKIEKISVGDVFELSANGKTYPIEANSFIDKVKVGDNVVAYLSGIINNFKKSDKNGKVISKLDEPVYMLSKITDFDGKLIYEIKSEKHAFGYEVNKARFATSKIKSIKKNIDGSLNKIVLNDGTFTMNFDLNGQNLKQDNFKVGDEVIVKFIGEKIVAKNEYSSSKLIVMYAQSKKYELKNETLFNRFYQKDGRQKVVAFKLNSAQKIVPKIISSSRIANNVKTNIVDLESETKDWIQEKISYSAQDSVRFSKDNSVIFLYGKAELSSKGMIINADEITFDNIAQNGTAKNAIIVTDKGEKIESRSAKFNLEGYFEFSYAKGTHNPVKP